MPKGPCTFCRIVAGELAVTEVVREGGIVAFLDHRPVFPGHVLVVPVDHHEVLADLPTDLLEPYFTRAQRLSVAMEDGLGSVGSFVAINNRVSQSVPHLHTHVVPRTPKDGLRGFFWPRGRYANDAEAAEVAARLRAALSRLEAH